MKRCCKILLIIASVLLLWASCRHDNEKPKIERLQFQESAKDMRVGENAAVGIKVFPENAKNAEKIKYKASGNGVVEIDHEKSSNDGVVLSAIGSGSSVISAEAQNIVDYIQINVSGYAETGIPYITVTDSVLEVPVGAKKHFMSTLQNGNPNDYLSFVYSNKERNIINYETANNTVVVEGIKAGSDIVTVRHPKSQYSVDVLVFVLETGEYAKYITGENVIFMEAGKDTVYSTNLMGVEESERGYSVYQVIEGGDIITVSGSGESCYITSKKEGAAKVRVTNRSVPYPFEFMVYVRGSEDVGYISMSSNFVILENSDIRNIYAYFNGDASGDIDSKYTWHFEDNVNDIVEVINYGNNFALRALKDGTVKLIIENEYSLVKQEVLIQVKFEKVNFGEMFITTSQNVIYMELGGADTVLKMKLVGGTVADKNSFEWVVEDSSIIEASVPAGSGTVLHRAVVYEEMIQEAEALITAKKAGTTYIRITNQKAPKSEVRVLVKVYPKGMFSGNTVSLGGSSLLKVKRGETLNVNVQVLSGSYKNTGELLWHIKNENVAAVVGAGVAGTLTALEPGITELIVTGQSVLNEYHAVVVVYEEGQEDTVPFIYTDKLQYKMYLGQTAVVYLYHPNIADEVFDYTIINTDTSVVYTRKQGDVIVLNAVEPGEAELVINTGIAGCNSLTITVNVELAELNTEKPYLLTGESSVVTYAGGAVEYSVNMAGAGETDKSRIKWTIDDDSVAALEMINGTTVVVRGVQAGQTVLRAESAKSANIKEIIVFVAATQSEAYAKVTLGLAKINYVLGAGDSFFVKLVTNANETQKTQFRWRQSDADILAIEDNYDTAFITAVAEGTSIITVDTRDNSHIMPLVLYVTVRSPVFNEVEIGFPSSVVLLKGQSKVIKGNALGSGGYDFIWNVEDDTIVQLIGSGIEAALWGSNAGQTFVTVSSYGFSKKILVICVDNEDDLENLWYFTADKTYFRIKKNEEARINLLFGENGFPDDQKMNIQWRQDLNNGVVSVSASGSSARVTGKNVGVARIIASHDWVGKDVEILIEVVDTVIGSDTYYMAFPAVSKAVKGVPQTIPVSLYKDDYVYTQGYNLITVNTEGKGIVEAELLNDTLRIMGRAEGREYVTLTHPAAGEYRMLVVVYEGQIPENDDPVIYVDKKYWSVYEGQESNIALQIAGGDEFTENGIMWVNHDPAIIRVDSSEKTNAKITGLLFGSTAVDITFNGNVVETIFVSVAKINTGTDIVVATESIIIMALDADSYHVTKVISDGRTSQFFWEIADTRIAEIAGFGDECYVYPKETGLTELLVKGYGYERRILVVVVQTEAEKMESRYLNIDKRYFKLKKGESTTVYPYYKMAKPVVAADNPHLHYDSGVVNISRSGEGFFITGKNEGIELITISNNWCENSIVIAVEVSSEISGGITENTSLVYMTTSNNLIMTAPDTYGYLMTVDIIGEYQGNNDDFIWTKDSNLIEWETRGNAVFFNTKAGMGEVNVTVENRYCQYPLKIKIVIENDAADTGVPYISSGKTVYQLGLTDDAVRVNFSINNIAVADYANVTFRVTGNAADISLNGSYFEARSKTQGISELEIYYPDAVSLKIYFIVSDNIENQAVYLTTAMNYVVVPKSKTKAVDVALINYTELNADNIRWESGDRNTAAVIGSGKTVQVYGVNVGFTKLTVKHHAAYNDLEIIVKVVEESDMSNVAYLTTTDNIIETYVQNNSLQVMVNKVGGVVPELEAVWTVDDPSVISIMGSGGIGYIVPKKAGIAKITVTEKETGKLDIVVIVKEAKAGSEYIRTDDLIVQINPGQMNHTIAVELVGGGEQDRQQFEWQIYSQLPSDYEVARNGGTVLSLFAMGDRAALSGNYVGTARIRVTHPKAQAPLYIVVQVTNFSAMAFNEKEVTVEEGGIYFAGIRVPNYENFSGKVEYSTDNPAVCVVTGSDKVALLQSQGVGKANITAIVRGTDLKAVVEVNVIARDNYAEPGIIVPKTTYLLNPRERPFQIEAYMLGVGVTEESRYGLKWEAMLFNGSDQGSVLDAINIFPSVAVEKPLYTGGDSVMVLQGTGPVIQVEVLNPKLPDGAVFQTKEIVIVVSQPEITSRTKTIYIKIAEISGIFTVSRSEIMMESGNSESLSCTILGGTNADYNEVVWITETDNVGREIARIMPNRRQNVTVFGINDGTVYVTAMYRNEIAECRVQVKSSLYLQLQYNTFFTYPGARQENGQYIEVEYEVRPFTTQIMWTPQGSTPDATNTVAVVTPVMQDYTTGKGKITINPVSEGSFEIIGIMSGRVARMTVIIQNVYRFQISNRTGLRMQPGYETTYSPEPNPERYWDYDSKYNMVPQEVDNQAKVGGTVYLPFVICPPDHQVKFSDNTKKDMEKYGIVGEISPIVKYGEMEGRGIIKLTTTKEIPKSEYGINDRGLALILDLKKPLDDTVVESYLYSANTLYPNNEIYLKSNLPLHETALIPVFQRVYGNYSNQNYKGFKYKYYSRTTSPNFIGLRKLTDGEIRQDNFDIQNSNWQLHPTGVMAAFNNAEYANSTSEYLEIVKQDNGKTYSFSDGGHKVEYNLEIGDGEEHYILLDKTHEGMYYNFGNALTEQFENGFNDTFYENNKEYKPKAVPVDINGQKAILITGGEDFVVYDQVKIVNRKEITYKLYGDVNKNIKYTDGISAPTGINTGANNSTNLNGTINGMNATDYLLVDNYGIGLKNTNATNYSYKDTLNANVRNQIVYLRKSNPYSPLRVEYNYTQSGSNINMAMRVVSGSINFTTAKAFFPNNAALYVTKGYLRNDRVYYIKTNTNGTISEYASYSATNQINGFTGTGQNMAVTHANRVSYNPHFENDYDGMLWIVSDFDLGAEGIAWYCNYDDYIYSIAMPNSTSGSTASLRRSYKYHSGDIDVTKNHARFFIDFDNSGNRIGRAQFLYFHDQRYHKDGGDFYCHFDGNIYSPHWDKNSDFEYYLAKGEGSLYKNCNDIVDMPLNTAGMNTLNLEYGYIYTTTVFNYRAILDILKDKQVNKNIIDWDKYYTSTTFAAAYNALSSVNKTAVQNALSQGDSYLMYDDNTRFLQPQYTPYQTYTLYIKREYNLYGRVHSLGELGTDNHITGITTGNWDGLNYPEKHLVVEDITTGKDESGNHNYLPAVTNKQTVIYRNAQPVQLKIQYENSYGGQNEVIINVTHVVRSGDAADISGKTTTWDKVKAVTNVKEKSGFSKYMGYFFVSKDYAED